MRRGVTLLETLTVIAIILVLAGLVFVFFKPTRIESLKVESRANLRQIYQAMVMYSNDNPGAPSHPDLQPLVYPAVHGNVLVLDLVTHYGLDRSQIFSPADDLGPTTPHAYGGIAYEKVPSCLEEHGAQCPIVRDHEIDKLLWPEEMDTDPYMLKKFEIQLLAGGEIRDVRYPAPRMTWFGNLKQD
ncbi:MAG: type II secretion system protein [Fimbriimonadaceae bacterium]